MWKAFAAAPSHLLAAPLLLQKNLESLLMLVDQALRPALSAPFKGRSCLGTEESRSLENTNKGLYLAPSSPPKFLLFFALFPAKRRAGGSGREGGGREGAEAEQQRKNSCASASELQLPQTPITAGDYFLANEAAQTDKTLAAANGRAREV